MDCCPATDRPMASQAMPHDPRSPVYTDDKFMMYCFKVLPCEKTYRHDWWACPFVHPGESAKRRDPRLYKYSAVACPNAKQGGHCPRGDRCPGTHSVFEYWLHPSRFRTQFCDRGIHCNQPFCFFAHTVEQLRMPSANEYTEGASSPVSPENNSSAVHSFDKSASFGPGARSMSFDRSTTEAFERSPSFDGVSPRMARLSEIQNSIFPRGSAPQMHSRRYSDFQAYDGVMGKAHINMTEPPIHIPRHLGNGQVENGARGLHLAQSLQERQNQRSIHALGSVSAGSTPRETPGSRLRSFSIADDFTVLQEIIERMSSASSSYPALHTPAVHQMPPRVWTQSYNNLGSPNSPLISPGNAQLMKGNAPKVAGATTDLEGAMSQLGLGLASTPLGLSG